MLVGFCAMEFRFMYGDSCEGAQSRICQQLGIGQLSRDFCGG